MNQRREESNLNFRKLKKEEHLLTRPLYETCFSEDEPAFVDYYYANRADRNEIYAAIAPETGQIVSMVHVNPVEVTGSILNHETLILPYFVAVATDPAYRRRGLMRTLMEMAMADKEKEGIPFGFLMPANEAYYTPLGFERAWEWKWEEECLAKECPGDNRFFEQQEVLNLSDEELEYHAGSIAKKLEERFDLYTRRGAACYRDLDLQQRVCGGKLLLETGVGQVRTEFMRCTFKEEFPPMMAKILNTQCYDEQIGRPLKDLKILISEVV